MSSTETVIATTPRPATPSSATPWPAVFCLALMGFALVSSEFMPVALLTPIASDLVLTEGQTGQAISVSGFFAVLTGLFSNGLLARIDRKLVVLFYTAVMVASSVVIALAPNGMVFMAGRALIGIAVGGFWSLNTALLARMCQAGHLTRAIATVQVGTVLSAILTAPLASYVAGYIGWRETYSVLVPVGLAALAAQAWFLPKLPSAGNAPSVLAGFRLLGQRNFALGMAAMGLAFVGQFSLSTYLRPVLEDETALGITGISLVFLAIGLAGLLGTSLIGLVLRAHLRAALLGIPALLALLAMGLVASAHLPLPTTALLVVWGMLVSPLPVVWFSWMVRAIPHDLEAGGGIQVALIQTAITFGAFTGGMLFDGIGWWATFTASAAFFAGSVVFAARTR